MPAQKICIGPESAGKSMLEALSGLIINESKTRLRRLVSGGEIRINGNAVSPGTGVHRGDVVTLPEELDTGPPPRGEMEIEALREDERYLAANKPAGLPVLPDRKGEQREFFDSLVAHLNRDVPEGGPYVRPHIVHRLDRDTSGVILVAKDTEASRRLSLQFQHREVSKTYLALVEGRFPQAQFTVDAPLGRAKGSELMMRVDERKGKRAVTALQREEVFGHFTLLRVRPETGRQHQIRVHMQAVGYPLAVDFLYGRRDCLRGSELNEILGAAVVRPEKAVLDRCPLHASEIQFRDPADGAPREITAPLAPDMREVLALLARVDAGP